MYHVTYILNDDERMHRASFSTYGDAYEWSVIGLTNRVMHGIIIRNDHGDVVKRFAIEAVVQKVETPFDEH